MKTIRTTWVICAAIAASIVLPNLRAQEKSKSAAHPGKQVDALSLDLRKFPAGSTLQEQDVLKLWPHSDSMRTMGRVKIVQGGGGSSPHPIFEVKYPKGGVGPKESGALFVSHLTPADEYYLSYRIRFSDNFDFAKGGKIHGLSSGGGKYSGGVIPKVGDGWSARLVWDPNGAISTYVYHVGMKGPWGDTWHLKGRFETGKWQSIVERVRLNTDNNSDGILQVWLDGNLALSRTDIRFRDKGMGEINSFLFSTFYGGHTPDFAPSRDGTIWFDDFHISATPPDFIKASDAP